jgi:hypothetical protein
MKLLSSKVIAIALCAVAFMPTTGACGESEGSLYAVRLVSAEIPLAKQKEIKKAFGAGLSETYIYTCILADGNLIWRSKKLKIVGNEAKFIWNATDPTSLAGIFWDTKSELMLKAFLSDDMTDATVSAGTIGAAGGAGLGALIGGIAAGVFTGGLGAPAGALIGAGIGGAAGGAGGAAFGAVSADDKVVFEKDVLATRS